MTSELGVKGQEDELHLEKATALGAVLVSQNQKHFAPLYVRWHQQGREHGGILLVRQNEAIGMKIERLERAARLLTITAARNQLMQLRQFDTEEKARAFVTGLTSASQIGLSRACEVRDRGAGSKRFILDGRA